MQATNRQPWLPLRPLVEAAGRTVLHRDRPTRRPALRKQLRRAGRRCKQLMIAALRAHRPIRGPVSKGGALSALTRTFWQDCSIWQKRYTQPKFSGPKSAKNGSYTCERAARLVEGPAALHHCHCHTGRGGCAHQGGVDAKADVLGSYCAGTQRVGPAQGAEVDRVLRGSAAAVSARPNNRRRLPAAPRRGWHRNGSMHKLLSA